MVVLSEQGRVVVVLVVVLVVVVGPPGVVVVPLGVVVVVPPTPDPLQKQLVSWYSLQTDPATLGATQVQVFVPQLFGGTVQPTDPRRIQLS